MNLMRLPLKWLKDCYNWVMKWAEHPKGTQALCFLSMIESIFFPIPVDPFLVAMGAAQPKKSLKFAFYATAFSLLGAVIGYYVGAMFWDATKQIFFEYIFSAEKFSIVSEKFQSNAFMTMFFAAFTPIPFKVFTLTAGATSVSLPVFIMGAALGRSMRFFIIGGALFFYGPQIRQGIEKYFDRITLGLSGLIIVGYILYKTVFAA